MSKLSKHFPIVGTLRSYDRGTLRDDLSAGLTTAIMLIPQAMAYAMLAGLDPIIGLYSSIVPLIAYAVLGTSRQLAVGPVAMVSLLVASTVGGLAAAGSAEYLAYAVLLAAMVGLVQLAMGFARIGFLVNFLSHPVVAGFTSAAAILIGLSQLKHVLGVEVHGGHNAFETVFNAATTFGTWHWLTVGIATGTLGALSMMKAINPKFPRFLVVVAGGTLAVWGLGLDAAGLKIVGEVPSGLPPLTVPMLDLGAFKALLPMAVTISLIGFMESISVAKGFARQGRYEVDADQELKALGAANLLGAFTTAYPTTGGFSRTAVNGQAGAKTTLAGLFTAGFVLVTLLLFTSAFTFLPKAVLAAIILSAVVGLIDVKEARHLWQVSRPDFAMMAITFFATLGLGIEEGILVGVVASLAWFVKTVSTPHMAELGLLEGLDVYRKLDRHSEAKRLPGLLLVRIDAPLFYANVNFIKQALRDLEEGQQGALRAVVIDAKGIGSVDASAVTLLEEIASEYRERGVQLWLAGVHGPVFDALDRAHLVDAIGRDRFVLRVHHAVTALTTDGERARGVA